MYKVTIYLEDPADVGLSGICQDIRAHLKILDFSVVRLTGEKYTERSN